MKCQHADIDKLIVCHVVSLYDVSDTCVCLYVSVAQPPVGIPAPGYDGTNSE